MNSPTIEVRLIDQAHRDDLDRCDGRFLINTRLALTMSDGVLGYQVVAQEPFEKEYPLEHDDDHGDAIYLAYIDGELAGQLALSRHWNSYARIDHLVVDAQQRQRGIGRALVAQAIAWSQQQGLAGVCLETQDNNVAACRLYASCDFVLRGFDQSLYRGLREHRNEVALFWYWEPSAMPLENLFSYGTLQTEAVQLATFGRRLHGSADTLRGYHLGMLRIEDPAVIATSGAADHPIIAFTGNAADEVKGMLLEITRDELLHADAYEVSDYQRIAVTLASGKRAWVYAKADAVKTGH